MEPALSELERDVMAAALDAYSRQMSQSSAASRDEVTNSSTATSSRLARRSAIARDLIGRI